MTWFWSPPLSQCSRHWAEGRDDGFGGGAGDLGSGIPLGTRYGPYQRMDKAAALRGTASKAKL